MMVVVEDLLKRYYFLIEKKRSMKREIEAIESELEQIRGAIAVLAEPPKQAGREVKELG